MKQATSKDIQEAKANCLKLTSFRKPKSGEHAETTFYPNIELKSGDSTKKLTYVEQDFVIGGSAKLPPKKNEETAKYIQLNMRRRKPDELKGSIFNAKGGVTPVIEKRRIDYCKNTNDFCDTLDKIDVAYKELYTQLKKDKYKMDGKVVVTKDHTKVTSFVQRTVKDKANDTEIALDEPIYRLRIPVDVNTHRLGNVDFETKAVKPVVFDLTQQLINRRKTGENREVEAKVKVNGKMESLTTYNFKEFLTPESVYKIVYKVNLPVISPERISGSLIIQKIYVLRNTSKMMQGMTDEQLASLDGEFSDLITEDNEDEDMPDEELPAENTEANNNTRDEEPSSNEEESDSDDD